MSDRIDKLNPYVRSWARDVKKQQDQKAKRDSTRKAENIKLYQDKRKRLDAKRSPRQVCMDAYVEKYASVDKSTESPEAKKERVAFRRNCRTKSDKK